MTSKKTIGLLAALCLALLAVSAAQGAGPGARYVFRGHLLATPPANATSISISVEGDGKTVTVNFFDVNKMIEDGGAFAFKDQYNAPVTYSWDGAEVAQEGEIPKAEGN